MKSIIQLKTATPPLLITLVIACFALSPGAQAVGPEAPDAALPNGNTAEGDGALSGLTGGFYNSAFGFLSLLSNADASFNTGVGAGTLLVNTANENTATGAGALLSNTTGFQNTANGTFALFNNTTGTHNTATGFEALFNNTNVDGNFGGDNTADGFNALFSNTIGFFNTATGSGALFNNSTGNNNTAVGTAALNNTLSNNNTAVGFQAGFNVTTADNVIAIGAGVNGVSTTNGQVDDSCYIGNIIGAGVDAGTAAIVFVDQDGKLGTTALPGTGALPNAHAASVKAQELETTVAQQAKAMEVLMAQLKEQATQIREQAAQIQKVSAQLEINKQAPTLVRNNQ